MFRPTATALVALLALGAAAQQEREATSSAAEREAVSITVYPNDLALIKERRRVVLPGGLTRLSLREVSAQMLPETALLRAASGAAVTALEQSFDFDLLTPQKLLEKYLGQEVTVLRSHPVSGEERAEKATVLSTQNGTVLRFADRIETGVPGRLAFGSVPPSLRDRPTLSVLLEAAAATQSLELSYLSTGLAWKADYVAHLSPDGRQLDLSGWVTLSNRSGSAYHDARLQLVAGNVNRATQDPRARAMLLAAPSARTGPEVRQESLLDHHLYSFERPTSIADNQTKQLALLSASAVPVRREYLLEGPDHPYRERAGVIGQKQRPAVFIEFDNRGGALGKPLPAGVVRVYARDSQGASQFAGEDRIDHTARDDTVRLRLGEAFDIHADRRQLSYRKLGENAAESSYRIDLRNAKDEKVTVRVQENFPGDWEVTQESSRHQRESARHASWRVDVPARGGSVLEYTVRVRW